AVVVRPGGLLCASVLGRSRAAVPAAEPEAAVEALANGQVAAVADNGTVSFLTLDMTTETYIAGEPLTPLNGMPSEPSALAVLESGSGQLVLGTSEDEEQLFVFEADWATGQAGVRSGRAVRRAVM